MSTATVTSKPVTFPCVVSYGDDWIEVKGRTRTLAIEGLDDRRYTYFSADEQAFLRKLTDGDNNVTMHLTVPEMRLFAACVDKFNARLQQEQKVEQEVEQIVKGHEHVLSDREALMASLKSTSEDKSELFRIVYYIPTRVSAPVDNGGHGRFANLAARMRAAGLIQFDGSTYCGKEGCIPSDVFEEMDDWNARPEVEATRYLSKRNRLIVKYKCEKIHPEQLEATRNEAFEALRDHVVEVQESLLESIHNAAKRCDEVLAECEKEAAGVSSKKAEEAAKRKIGNMGAALSVARKKLADAIHAAEIFDETESLKPLFQALKSAIAANEAALIALRNK